MPLGNYTSQFFANVYLNELDHYVKHILKSKYYIRYVDDFVILHNNREQLEKWKEEIDNFLKKELKLELHPTKSQVFELKRGVNFLGFKIFNNFKLVRKSNLRKFEKKFKELKILYKENQIPRDKVVERLEGWLAYASHGDTYKYRRNIIKEFNKNFPIRNKIDIIKNKKMKNFYRKIALSNVEFSTQKTLSLAKKGLSVKEIAVEREIKEGTVWSHFANLIEHGQISVWRVMPKSKIIKIIPKIKRLTDRLRKIKERLKEKNITFDEIDCVLAHIKFKEKIRTRYRSR